jgi:hypothetical protein
MIRPHRLQLVILAQLAALGCAEPPTAPTTPMPAAPVVPVPVVPAPVAPVTAAPPVPSDTVAVPPPSPTATAIAPPTKEGDTCSRAVPCPPPLSCQLGFDGARFSETGTCSSKPVISEGRPLVIDGEHRTAALEHADHVDDVAVELVPHDPALAAMLARAAQEEHASVAAFGRTLLVLMHLGAPTALLRATQDAIADELRHADDTLAAAVAHGHPPGAFGALPAATAPFVDDVARTLLDDVLAGGCIGETLAAFRAEARAAQHPSIRGLCARIADDEARHAALAFATARFLLDLVPDLQAVGEEVFASFCASAAADDVARVAPVWRAAFAASSVAPQRLEKAWVPS